MAQVTGLTKDRMLAIEAASVVDGLVDVNGNLILTKHDGTNINAGSVIGPQGDAGDDGLDAAPGSVLVVGDTTPIRTSDGRVKAADPTENDDVATKLYLDTLVDPLASRGYVDAFVKGVELGAAVDLNTITEPGIYLQSASAEATDGVNYPTPVAGVLEVFNATNGALIWQRYTPYGNFASSFFTRAYYAYASTWYAWQRFNSESVLPRVASGKYTSASTVPAASGVSIAVTFPAGRFTAPPAVTLNPTNSSRLQAAANAVTATGFSARLDNFTDGTAAARDFNWIAVQE